MEKNDLENSLLFSSKDAEKLNEYFANATAPYLFLFCNYNPRVLCNSHGKNFTNAIGNIYRLCNDTGRIIRKRDIFNTNYLISNDRKFWSDYLNVLDTLRAYDGHNNSDNNGDIQKELIEKAEKFYKSNTGKEYKDLDESDFEKLIELIFEDTKRFKNLTEKIINSIKQESQYKKEKIIKNCESNIIRYYALPYGNIILGQVKTLRKVKNDYDAEKLFQYYLGSRKNPITSFSKPKEYFEYYMKNCFVSDIKEFLRTYINDPAATMLPHGLIQGFIYRMIYPVQKEDKIELDLSKMKYNPNTSRFFGKNILINKLNMNVVVNIGNNIEAKRLDEFKKSPKEICTVQANVSIEDIYNRNQCGIVPCIIK